MDPHVVDPTDPSLCGEPAHLPLLAVVEVIERIAGTGRGLDFYGSENTADRNNEIDLATANTNVAIENLRTPSLQEPGGD